MPNSSCLYIPQVINLRKQCIDLSILCYKHESKSDIEVKELFNKVNGVWEGRDEEKAKKTFYKRVFPYMCLLLKQPPASTTLGV